jgi:NTE family protein
MKKALILSGGGGRGAFQAGAIAGLVEAGWMPDGQGPAIIAGTSIGGVNGAALASGRTVAELYEFWTAQIATETVHARGLLGVGLPLAAIMAGALSPTRIEPDDSSAVLTPDEQPAEPEPPDSSGFAGAIARAVRDLLLRAPELIRSDWETAIAPLALDWQRINSAAAPTLLITATDVQSGAAVVFDNRQPAAPLAPPHLAASASIQVVYQPTEIAGRFYWDGAVLNNTPLDPLLDHVGADHFDQLEIVSILMSPWPTNRLQDLPLPGTLYQTLAPALDWMLLGSYRAALKRLSDRYLPGPRVIAPDYELWHDVMNIDRLLLYDRETSVFLWERGRQAALAAIKPVAG